MATHITSECIVCGACAPECPNGAITQGDEVYVIDPARCTECVGFFQAEACQSVCPTSCCVPDPERAETEAELVARALALHPDDASLAERVRSNTYPSRFRAS
jgi:ferredoxin